MSNLCILNQNELSYPGFDIINNGMVSYIIDNDVMDIYDTVIIVKYKGQYKALVL